MLNSKLKHIELLIKLKIFIKAYHEYYEVLHNNLIIDRSGKKEITIFNIHVSYINLILLFKYKLTEMKTLSFRHRFIYKTGVSKNSRPLFQQSG